MLALTTLGHAIFWFALSLFDLAVIGFAGPDLVVDAIHKIPVHGKATIRWVREHPIAFTLDLVASFAFTGFWLQALTAQQSGIPLWLSLIIVLVIFGSSLLWWPRMIGFIVKHPVSTGVFVLMVLCSALGLYFLTVADWVKNIFVTILIVAAVCILLPMFIGMFVIMAPVIWGAMLAAGYSFRILVTWLGLHGIAKLLESTALVALGLAEYFHFYHIDENWGQLAYFGAFSGALSVGFTVLSLLPDKQRAWLGDTKKSHG